MSSTFFTSFGLPTTDNSNSRPSAYQAAAPTLCATTAEKQGFFFPTDGGRLERHALSSASCLANRPCSPCTFTIHTEGRRRHRTSRLERAPPFSRRVPEPTGHLPQTRLLVIGYWLHAFGSKQQPFCQQPPISHTRGRRDSDPRSSPRQGDALAAMLQPQ